CNGTSTVQLIIHPLPTMTISASLNPICSGNSSTLSVLGANVYTWMPGSFAGASLSVNPATTTTYSVTGISLFGCVNTQTFALTVNPTPTVVVAASNGTICAGETTTLTLAGATNYTTNPGSLNGNTVSVSPGSTTTYTVNGALGS